MKRILAACLVVSCCTGALAARADEPSFTLAQALERAGATSPAIESGAAGVLAAQAARAVAGLRPNPELNIQTENVAGSGDYRGFAAPRRPRRSRCRWNWAASARRGSRWPMRSRIGRRSNRR